MAGTAGVPDRYSSFKSASIEDIRNRDDYKASGASLSGGYGKSEGSGGNPGNLQNFAGGTNGGAAGYGSAKGSQSSTTASAISGIAGDTQARTGDKRSGALAKAWDGQQLEREVQAQTQITATFWQQANKAAGDFADKRAEELRNGDHPEDAIQWQDGGTARNLLHTIIGGLTGGASGALGASATSFSAPYIAATINATDLPEAARGGLIAAISTGLGASVGGGLPGAASAFNQVINNCLAHECLSIQWDKNAPGYHAYKATPSPSLCNVAEAGCMDAVKKQLACNSAPGQPKCSTAGSTTEAMPLSLNNWITQYLSPNGEVVINGTEKDRHMLDDGYVMRWISKDPDGSVRINTYGEGVNKDWKGVPGGVMASVNSIMGPAIFNKLGIDNQVGVRNELNKR
ncbi:hypothetical protein DFQ15_1462 [Xylophilus ampelinus]|uniref:Uncharacterized protein n=1 Tax=Xylophilus ampelinus TaxID=54067 RepID=A0A318SCX0_9BURK|nr:hypothetical protein DFQ15_1462 [Xylophilus ampelinus]